MTKHLIIATVIFFVCFSGFSQSMETNENELLSLLTNLRAAENDSDKEKANELFRKKLAHVIENPLAFDYPFEKLTTLGSIKSMDNELRLFNWNVEQDDGSQKYYCFTLRYDARKKKYYINELVDNSVMLPHKPTEILESENWYGALYYKIIPVDKGSKKVYTVLGWDGNTTMTNCKVIDVLSFTGSQVKIGSPMFKQHGQTLNRVYFEFSEKCTMYLNYEEDRERIILDHLMPEVPSMKGIYSFYVPDLSYDAYVIDKNKWILVEDVIGINRPGSEKSTIIVLDENGKLKEKKIKNKWLDPSDKSTGDNVHVATMPDEEVAPKESKNKEEAEFPKQSRREKRKNPTSYNPVNSKKRK